MTALNVVALIFCLHIMADFLDARNCRFLGLCALATPAITGTLLHGQTAIFTVLLITLAMREKSDSRGGLWVGLLAFKPVLVLQMMGWLVIKRRWRALAIAIGISAALALASIATSGIMGLRDHLALLRAVGSHLLNAAEIVSQPTLAGLTMVLGLGWIGWAVLAIPVGIGVVISRNRPDFDSIALLGSILVAPYLHNTEDWNDGPPDRRGFRCTRNEQDCRFWPDPRRRLGNRFLFTRLSRDVVRRISLRHFSAFDLEIS